MRKKVKNVVVATFFIMFYAQTINHFIPIHEKIYYFIQSICFLIMTVALIWLFVLFIIRKFLN